MSLILLFAVGCGEVPVEESPQPRNGDTGEPAWPGTTVPCPDGRFEATPRSWALPGGYGAETPFSSVRTYTDDEPHEVVDMNGDGRPDLVVSHTGQGAADFWAVYVNTGTGFAANAEEWTLPSYEGLTFETVSPTLSEYYADHRLVDMTGDGLPDLVVPDDDVDEGSEEFVEPGITYWHVIENTGHGFSDTPLEWSLPGGYPAGQLRRAESATRHELVDLTADGRPDLVVTGQDLDEDGETDPVVGSSWWLVYDNEGDGFAEVPIEWGLPPAYAGEGLIAPTYQYHASIELQWASTDIDADGHVDLVVTADESDDPVGRELWRVYDGTGAGFSETARAWALPEYEVDGLDPGFALMESDSGGFKYDTRDLTGDGVPELIVSDPGDEPFDSLWRIHASAADGFQAVTQLWEIPYLGDELASHAPFDHTEGRRGAAWATLDIDADGLPDLVTTLLPADTAVGRERWDIYRGVCE